MTRIFLLLLLALAWLLPAPAIFAQETTNAPVAQDGAELWNAVREREGAEAGITRSQVKGVDSTELINAEGEAWREFRMDNLLPAAGIFLGLLLVGIVAFRLIRGKIPIQAGPTEKKIKRFTVFQRYVHWITAILFVLLSLTGVFLMFGRYLIMPIFGSSAGGSLMYLLKQLHNITGPLFALALVVLTVTFFKGNLFKMPTDWQWVKKGGGLLGDHAPSGRYNAGEKGWYWLAVVFGVVVVISGLVLNFANFGQSREIMITYHMLHSITAVFIMGVSMGHIYMGTIAMQGALEPMVTGYADANWAKEHHDEWYEQAVKDGDVLTADEVERDKQQATNAKQATQS